MRKARTRTRVQVEASKARAERFVRDVLEDDERADEIADESVESYAERRRFQIENPGGARRSVRRATAPSDAGRGAGGGLTMKARRNGTTLRERLAALEAENAELQDENEELHDRLDRIVGAAVGDEEEFDEDDDQADDEDDDQDDDDQDDEDDDEE